MVTVTMVYLKFAKRADLKYSYHKKTKKVTMLGDVCPSFHNVYVYQNIMLYTLNTYNSYWSIIAQ